MFTGIIKEMGKVLAMDQKASVILRVSSRKIKPLVGASVAVNGACLTVCKKGKTWLEFKVVPETLSQTNLGELKKGDLVNLEPSLKLKDSIDGHFVSGHIDCTVNLINKNRNKLTFGLPLKFKKYVVEKGSVALNGVSLTVTHVEVNNFSAALIPFTLKNTNLSLLKKCAKVNLEVDLIARYIIATAT